jgi:CubicO group peptidase (beta-lactamase class C family)
VCLGVDDLSGLGSVNDKVFSLLMQQVADGRQIGVQVCAYKDNKVIVDTFAGSMGPDDPRPIQADSLFLSWSTTKGVAATALHILADKGLIMYDAPVAEYWPEFAANGKDKITVAQAMSHQVGLHAMPTPFNVTHLTDWNAGIKWVEEGKPAYEPGSKTGYHGITFGWIVGGIVQGASGRHIQEFIAEEIAKPLGIEQDMYVGIPDDVEERLTTLEIWNIDEMQDALGKLGREFPPDFEKALPSKCWRHFNSMSIRKACLPSGNGHFTARALAKIYAALANEGSITGVTLVSPDRIKHMNRVMTEDNDIVVGRRTRKGIGFFLGGEIDGVVGPMGPRITAFGHGGAGGSTGFADPEAGLAIAVTLNKMESDPPGKGRTQEICDLIRAELGVA